jgi:hypothetical protein
VAGRRLPPILLLAVAALAGCDETPPRSALAPDPPARTGQTFDPAGAGAIAGRVTWSGPLPVIPSYRSAEAPLNGLPTPLLDWRNPNAPRIDPSTRGVRAVVYLRGVDARRGRTWDHAPVRVEVADGQFRVLQGERCDRVGFVRRGDEVRFASRRDGIQVVQGRGANFFSLPLPRPGSATMRRLDRPGVVELFSGTGQFWMRGHLFVSDHPYLALCDEQGQFRLDRVPAGNYDLVCWLPDWREAERELNGDTARLCRVTFRPPRATVQRVEVRAGVTEVSFRLSE